MVFFTVCAVWNYIFYFSVVYFEETTPSGLTEIYENTKTNFPCSMLILKHISQVLPHINLNIYNINIPILGQIATISKTPEICKRKGISWILYGTCSSPRRPLFLHVLSFECTSNCALLSQPIFSVFSYLKNALHNLVIKLCSAPFFSKILYRYLLTSRTVL